MVEIISETINLKLQILVHLRLADLWKDDIEND